MPCLVGLDRIINASTQFNIVMDTHGMPANGVRLKKPSAAARKASTIFRFRSPPCHRVDSVEPGHTPLHQSVGCYNLISYRRFKRIRVTQALSDSSWTGVLDIFHELEYNNAHSSFNRSQTGETRTAQVHQKLQKPESIVWSPGLVDNPTDGLSQATAYRTARHSNGLSAVVGPTVAGTNQSPLHRHCWFRSSGKPEPSGMPTGYLPGSC
ncbi:hypothetical protein FN846DRAFT_892884 [Sphaerosporella brunnea]|uniref:Uncharacterized protein n=1 Tax=Sphaerosporella brunnea TaxID=1250544 RepID=A0A5J5EMH6_9PEZI|nr:hypothetical protein FN846DRAFT_892884 [Sphaerosporella brunnea]